MKEFIKTLRRMCKRLIIFEDEIVMHWQDTSLTINHKDNAYCVSFEGAQVMRELDNEDEMCEDILETLECLTLPL